MLQVASAAEPTEASYFTFDEATGTITNYDSVNGPSDVVIPSTINGVAVVAIAASTYDSGSHTFSGSFSSAGLTSVEIPNSVTTIGDFAFENNPLVSVVIGTTDYSGEPELTLTNNFSNLPTLTSVTLGNNINAISGSFAETGITALTIPSSVTTINDGSFYQNSIVDLSIPNTVTALTDGAFGNSLSLETLRIGTSDFSGEPSLVISGGTLYSLPNLQSLVLGNNVLSIESGFYNIPSLTSVDLGESIQTIGSGAFGQIGITEILIPNSVKELTGGAFSNNLSLKTVTIGTEDYTGTPTAELSSAFYNLPALESVTINGVVKGLIGSFDDTPSLTSLDLGDTIEEITNGAFSNNKLTSLFIPNSVKTLDGGAFTDSSELKSITFGDETYSGTPTVELNSAFYGDKSKLETITVNGVVRVFGASFYGTPALHTLDIRGFVEQITLSAFCDSVLQSVALPNSVTYVGASAFCNNSQLKTVIFGDETYSGAPNLVVGSGAFNGTTSIENVEFHNNLRTIESGVFYNNKLTKLELPATLESIGGGAFWNNYITEITVAGSTPIEVMSFSGNTANTGEYVRLYTSDPSNPYSYQDLVDDDFSFIVNPAAVQTYYVDADGDDLMPDEFRVGESLRDYTIAANPSADFTQYYRIGNTESFTPSDVDGYITPAGQTPTFAPGTNVVTFVYNTPSAPGGDGEGEGGDEDDGNGEGGDDGGSDNDSGDGSGSDGSGSGNQGGNGSGNSTNSGAPGAPNTGIARVATSISPLMIVGTVVVILGAAIYRKN